MGRIFSLLIFVIISSDGFSQSKDYVEVIYFHRTDRCKTCMSIEKLSSELLNKEYSKEVKSGEIVLSSIDYEKEGENELVKSNSIEGPTFVVIFHQKSKISKHDLTNEAFSYALAKPEKFQKVLKEKIDMFFR